MDKAKKIGSHLHLNPDGIKDSMNHADAAQLRRQQAVLVCSGGGTFVAGPVFVCLSAGARPMFLSC